MVVEGGKVWGVSWQEWEACDVHTEGGGERGGGNS